MLKQNLKKIAVIIGFILLTLLGWLIYQKYFKPTYNLNALLPADYQISLELSLNHDTFPALEQEKLLQNKGLSAIYQQINQQLNNTLNTLPNNEAKNVIKNSEQSLIFFENPKTFGLILKVPFTQNAEKISALDFQPLFSARLNQQILVLTNNQTLLEKIQAQNIKPIINPYLSFTLNPWLKVSLNKSFFTEKYDYPILADLQQILLPLNFNGANAYSLELDNQNKSLEFKLTPQTPASETGDLQNFIKLTDPKTKLSLGFTNIKTITQELDNNQNFKNLWNRLDRQLFISQQLSLAQLSQNLNSPVILAFGDNFWQIVTSPDEESLTKTILTNYFAQFKPKEIKKILPDGTRAVELVADPAKITWQEADLNGSKIIYQNTASGKLGWLVNNDKLIISNKIDQISFSPYLRESEAGKNTGFTCGNISKMPIINAFYLNPQFSHINLNSFLTNFSYFSGVSYTNGEIRLCLGLK